MKEKLSMKNQLKKVLAISLAMCTCVQFTGALPVKVLAAEDGAVAIDEAHFPDEGFREYLRGEYDSDEDGYFSDSELKKMKYLWVTYEDGINNFKGLKYLKYTTSLRASGFPGEGFDVSEGVNLTSLFVGSVDGLSKDVFQKNTKLNNLSVSRCDVKTLDFSNNTELTSLTVISDPALTTIDISKCTKLTSLATLNSTSIIGLDISNSPDLQELMITGNPAVTSLDLSNNLKLKSISASNTGLTSLDVSMLEDLEQLSLDKTKLTSLDVSNNKKLMHLYISQIPTLEPVDISNNTELEDFCWGYTDKCTTIDLSHNTKLKQLVLRNSNLTSVDISMLTELKDLFVDFTKITSIDISKCTKLETISCANSPIESLDISNNPNLFQIRAEKMSLMSFYVPEGYSDRNTSSHAKIDTQKRTLTADYDKSAKTDYVNLTDYGVDASKVTLSEGASYSYENGVITFAADVVYPQTVKYSYDTTYGDAMDVTLTINAPIKSIKGDVDENGVIDVLDMEMIQKYLLGMENLSESQLDAALIVNETIPSVLDMEAIQKYLLGMITEL
jgi:hypothetical protein